jgi:hypothetical protein
MSNAPFPSVPQLFEKPRFPVQGHQKFDPFIEGESDLTAISVGVIQGIITTSVCGRSRIGEDGVGELQTNQLSAFSYDVGAMVIE